ncbi:MAG: site-specific DNA-methyltransferase [Chloroflexi bacterium]|nr:site-specific DNA-methyltransferase [Chloroflexota bacterium]
MTESADASPRSRANSLDGSAWTRHSISIWSDLRKTAEEAALHHPALFPMSLPARLIDCFMPPGDGLVIDPFAGVGSTPLAACLAGRQGLGIELSPTYVEKALKRYEALKPSGGSFRMIQGKAADLSCYVEEASADLCVTSPPYWNILKQRRSADGKAGRDYGDDPADLGTIDEYEPFLDALESVFSEVFAALRPGGYCCAVVMDLRKGCRFYPFHSDLAARLQRCGFIFDDLIIWDRRQEYSNLRPLGYPAVFRINKVHEFIVIARKPRQDHGPTERRR